MDAEEIEKYQKKFGLLGESEAIKDVIRTIMQISDTDITVLITGETGTGKELIANAIHNQSLRKHEEFVKVNCGAIPSGILESELFGHKEGSFTGAVEDREGYFETANGGSIFLDEIGEMPPETQVKFLRVLETGEFMPVGGSETKQADVRIIAATNKNLQEELGKEKGFRKDLYYRIKTLTIEAPALRDRPEDISVLADHFALRFANRNQIPFKGFSPKAMDLMENYSWPGNVRELRNFVESMLTLNKDEVIDSDIVASKLDMETAYEPSSDNLPMNVDYDSHGTAERELILRQLFMIRKGIEDLKRGMSGQNQNMNMGNYEALPSGEEAMQKYKADVLENSDMFSKEPTETEESTVARSEEEETLINKDKLGDVTLEDIEKELIKQTLDKFNFQKRKTAQALDISERTLYRKIKKYDLKE